MVHRLLKEHWARAGVPLTGAERDRQEERLAGVAAQCSERERAAMKAERDVDAFYAALFMVDHVGERLEAVVAGVSEGGLFCELKKYFVEGMVRAEGLGDGVRLDEERHRLVVPGSGASYGVGDELLVDVLAADPVRRRIELGFVEKEKDAKEAVHEAPERQKRRPERPRERVEGAARHEQRSQAHRPGEKSPRQPEQKAQRPKQEQKKRGRGAEQKPEGKAGGVYLPRQKSGRRRR
jgi:ribonuclease R